MVTSNHQFSSSKHFTFEQIADGIYVAIPTEDGMAFCNAGVVDLGESAVIFDSFLTPQAAWDLRLATEQVIGTPIKFVINSHWHADHIGGNQVFPSTAVIISTSQTRKFIKIEGETGISWHKEKAQKRLTELTNELKVVKDNDLKREELHFYIKWYQSLSDSTPEIRLTIPDVSFNNKLTLNGNQRSVEIINVGEGHTKGDAIMHVLEEEILFMGDLLFVECHPYLGGGDLKKWVKTLKNLKTLKITKFVPGHGSVGTLGDMEEMVRYISRLEELASAIGNVDNTTQQVVEQKIPHPYDKWNYQYYFVQNWQYIVDGRIESEKSNQKRRIRPKNED